MSLAPAAPPTPAPTVVKAAANRARATAPGTTPAQAPPNPTDVWVNLSTKAYHCPGTKYYGATKHGKYLSDADAKAEAKAAEKRAREDIKDATNS